MSRDMRMLHQKLSFLRLPLLSFFLLVSYASVGQQRDSVVQDASLPNLIRYALERQPVIRQSIVDQEITEQQIKSRLADWYPQISFNGLYQHNFQVQTNIIGGNPVQLGVKNTSALQGLLTQNIFNRDLLLANQTRREVRLQAAQQTTNVKIDVVSNVSKAFYDLVATEQQIKVANNNIIRLSRSLKDATAQYEAGIVDKTDYKRATILLNNALAAKKSYDEAMKGKTENLKALIGYPVTIDLRINYDSASLEQDIPVDTLQPLDVNRRIEFQQLLTQRNLQEANVDYNRWAYLPTLSANAAYFRQYLNDDFKDLYRQAFPQSYAGVVLALPIFQGGKRRYNLRAARLQVKRVELDLENSRNNINSEYAGATANYKASLANFRALKENVSLAQEVYDVINLQYRSGIRAYLEVVLAESDLRTAQLNYFDALYQVLAARVDVERALGNINPR